MSQLPTALVDGIKQYYWRKAQAAKEAGTLDQMKDGLGAVGHFLFKNNPAPVIEYLEAELRLDADDLEAARLLGQLREL